MQQSKRDSLIESIVQTVVGLGVSVALQAVLYPIMGIPVTFRQNLIITAVFFMASLLRGYLLRRLFNKSR
jgi:hypothetical protein